MTMKKTMQNVVMMSVLGTVICGLAACGDGVLPETGAVVYHSPAQVETLSPQTIASPAPTLSREHLEQYAPILESFESNASNLLRRPDIETRLEQIESVFVVSGRYFELVAIFQEDVKAHGLDTPAAPALGWAYLQLGQRKLARDLIDRMITEKPESSVSWLLDGNYWLVDAESSQSSARKAKESFEKALAVEPGFRPFRRMGPSSIRQQVQQLERRLPDPGTEPVEVAQVEEHPVVEEPVVEEAPVVEEPVVEDAPVVEEAPGVEDTPIVEDAPGIENTPVEMEIQTPNAAILVAHGQRAMARGDGHLEQAQSFFQQALAADEKNLEAAMGLLYVAARSGAPP
ncbi:MAG: hypothetical protein ACNA8W_03395, partial [Bradymonadaceae bacterium]